MATTRWYLTIKVFRLLIWLGLPVTAERWATWSGLREALLRGLG